jgi:hypothetical protein
MMNTSNSRSVWAIVLCILIPANLMFGAATCHGQSDRREGGGRNGEQREGATDRGVRGKGGSGKGGS